MRLDQSPLPQLGGGLFLTDGGIETTLIFHEGWALPYFAAFDLLKSAAGTAALYAYYERYAAMASACGLGFVLESPTWRASSDWGGKLGYSGAGRGQRQGHRPDGPAARRLCRRGQRHGDQRLRRPEGRRL